MSNDKKIWKHLSLDNFGKVGQHIDFTPRYIGASVLLQHIMSLPQGHLSEVEVGGAIIENKDDPEGKRFVKMVEQKGGRLIHQWVGEGYNTYLLLTDHGIVGITVSETYLKLSVISSQEEFVEDLRTLFKKEMLPSVQSGHIFAIVQQGGELRLTSIGDASVPLVDENYTPEVMEDYKFAIKDLNSKNPSGRIVIMEGEPGTGKTHLIRAMLTEVSDAMFVLLSPEIVPSLAGPELLPLLISNKQNYGINGPIILVLEDADKCLVARGSDNINSIQSLLNLGDGILGSLLDLRIVATTNAKKLEMESAILRPGRLSKRLEVGALDLQTAKSIYRRLRPINQEKAAIMLEWPKELRDKMTLAEVYALARKHGWEPGERDKKKSNAGDPNPSYY